MFVRYLCILLAGSTLSVALALCGLSVLMIPRLDVMTATGNSVWARIVTFFAALLVAMSVVPAIGGFFHNIVGTLAAVQAPGISSVDESKGTIFCSI